MASVTSWGVTLSAQTETGSPLRTAIAMIFVPLPRFVFPTLRPLSFLVGAKLASMKASRPMSSLASAVMILVVTPERTTAEIADDKSGKTDIGRGDRPRVHRSVTPIGHRLEPIAGFSTGVLGHRVVFLVSG
jgi:hypothetical protein